MILVNTEQETKVFAAWCNEITEQLAKALHMLDSNREEPLVNFNIEHE
jgi:hypothetical protein